MWIKWNGGSTDSLANNLDGNWRSLKILINQNEPAAAAAAGM